MPRQQQGALSGIAARQCLRLACLLAVAVVLASVATGHTSAMAKAQTSADRPAPVQLNPTGRTLSLIVEIRDGDRRLGEAAIKIAPDQTLSVHKKQLAHACAPLLRDELAARLRALPARQGFLRLADLQAAGFAARLDPATMRLQFTPSVEQRPRGTVRIAPAPVRPGSPETPARLSGYLNMRAATDYVSMAPGGASGITPARANLEAVIRWQDIVLETEVSYDGTDTRNPLGRPFAVASLEGFTRRGTRLVHDRPQDALRLQAGDINPPTTSFQRGPDVLGISVERSLRKLRPNENIRPTGKRSFRISRPSTVKIELNGVVARQIRLDPGEYDLTDLPLRAGANDIRLLITDDLGEQRELEFTSYFDATLLAPDVHEWGFAAGVLSRFDHAGLGYDYDSPIATGFYRRGLSPELTGEMHVQASTDAAMAGSGFFAATPVGYIGIETGLSYHQDDGPGAALQVDWDAPRSLDTGAGLRMSAELRSPSFSAPGEDDVFADYWLSLLASYTRPLPWGIHANLSGRYALASGTHDTEDTYGVRVAVSKGLSYALGLSLSLEYSSDPLDDLGSGDGLEAPDADEGEVRAGVRLSWRPDTRTNVETQYESASQTSRVSASRKIRRGTGSWAASIETIHDEPGDDLAVDGGITYSGNRAVVSLDHTASLVPAPRGLALPALTDQRTTLRLGTAIAFADGHVALGPPITGGFAIVAPHDSLEERRIMLGDPARPHARSDMLGPAIIPDLPAYTPRTVRYDVDDLPVGYDLGSRTFTLEPPYKAGYALSVGSAYSVSAFGTLIDEDAEPVALVTGTATPKNGDGPTVKVFTNGAGRFGAQGLSPGRWAVEMASDPPKRFVLDIPENTEGLYRAGTLRPSKIVEEP